MVFLSAFLVLLLFLIGFWWFLLVLSWCYFLFDWFLVVFLSVSLVLLFF